MRGPTRLQGSIHVLPNTIRRGDHLVSLDLSDGFFHLAIRPADRKFFAFEAQGRYYQCVGMPMGWSHAPGMFTD